MLYSNQNNILKKTQQSKAVHPIFKYIAYFSLLDVLIFPYFSLIVFPYSLPIVFMALIFLRKIKVNKLFLWGISLVFLFMIFSVLWSLTLKKSQEFLIEDFMRLFQFITSFVYYFYFYSISDHLNTKTTKHIMLVGVIYIVVVGIAFVFDPMFSIILRQSLYPATAYGVENILIHSRYTYIFSDPNTAGYFFLIITFFIIVYFKNSLNQIVFLIISIIFIIVITQSVGVMLSSFVAIILILAKSVIKLKVKLVYKIIYISLALCLLVFLIKYLFPDFSLKMTDFINAFTARSTVNIHQISRLRIYSYAISNFIPSLLGVGYTLLHSDGSFFKPHSDHLRLLYSYGVIAYIVILPLFFRRILRINYLFLIPAFVAFTVNSLIDEQKLLALFLILLALADSSNHKEH